MSTCRSAHALARDEIDDREQDDGAEERDEQARRADRARVYARSADHRPDQPAAQQGTDDADDDVHGDAHAAVATHDDARQPSNHAANDQPENDTHDFLLSSDST